MQYNYGEMTDSMWLFIAELWTEPQPDRQCEHETIESRIGACDGGERCRKMATCQSKEGIWYCNQHGRD